ncbi:periplasmic binding family protein, partial [Vibrio parahaemolyticus V-223/04]
KLEARGKNASRIFASESACTFC